MSITRIDRPTLKVLRVEIDAALQVIADRHGLTLERTSCSYTPDGFRVPTRFVVGADADGVTPQERVWNIYCSAGGLAPEDFGRSFGRNGRRFTISGWRPKAHKRPVSATDCGGREYCFAHADVKRALRFADLEAASAVGGAL